MTSNKLKFEISGRVFVCACLAESPLPSRHSTGGHRRTPSIFDIALGTQSNIHLCLTCVSALVIPKHFRIPLIHLFTSPTLSPGFSLVARCFRSAAFFRQLRPVGLNHESRPFHMLLWFPRCNVYPPRFAMIGALGILGTFIHHIFQGRLRHSEASCGRRIN